MTRVSRQKLVAGGVALLVAGSAGGAYAATQSGTNSRQAFLNDVAKRLNVSPAQLRAAVDGALLDRLNAAVKAGRLTQAQADALKQRIGHGGPLALGPLPGPKWRHGFGPMGPNGFGPMGPHGFGPMGLAGGPGPLAMLPTVANYLGLSPAQLVSDLRGGKSLAQIAQAKNKSVSGLERMLTMEVQSRLAKVVSAGILTKAQEQRIVNRLSARIGSLVNAHPRFQQVLPGPRFPMGAPPPLPGPALGVPAAPPPPSA